LVSVCGVAQGIARRVKSKIVVAVPQKLAMVLGASIRSIGGLPTNGPFLPPLAPSP
jgi:hypothetical protein